MNSNLDHISLQVIDYVIIAIYFGFVIGVGYRLKKFMVTSEDFLLAGRGIPTWATGIAFMAANLGAIEVMGMVAMAYQYGLLTVHFYWIGAIPAMIFLSLFMMPVYYGSKVRSVPEYLHKRFNEHTRAFNAVSFIVLTVLMSGVNLYAMALVLNLLLHWNLDSTVLLAAGIVLAYTLLGGLTSSIYNEVIQFFLIIAGILPVTILGLMKFGGWENLTLDLRNQSMAHMWLHLGSNNNLMGVDWITMALGLGFVLSFGYWCTDFLVIQRAMAARNQRASQRTPLIAAFPKMLFPLITVIPGLIAIVVFSNSSISSSEPNLMLPLLMGSWFPNGLLGLGLTALLASFMSGMAGSITAFNTVWTYDIYQGYIARDKSDRHYLWMGRMATLFGVLISIAASYLVRGFPTIMDYMQFVFTIFHAPLVATILLGMFWMRTTPWGAFFGLVIGTTAAVCHYFFTEICQFGSLDYLPSYLKSLSPLITSLKPHLEFRTVMAANFSRAIFAFLVSFVVTLLLSIFTKPKSKEELSGLVWSQRVKEGVEDENERWFSNPYFLAIVLLIFLVLLNLSFV